MADFDWQKNFIPLPRAKRIFDALVSAALLALVSPFFIFTVLAFSLEWLFLPSSRGHLFYKEVRISGGRRFNFYKFGIFKQKAVKAYFDRYGFVQTKALEQNRNNLTWTGRVLKQIYMDELPQLYNVLKGDMTLVGPRPSNVVVSQEDLAAGRYQRWIFICGLTGPFQAQKDSGKILDQSEIDMTYIRFCRDNPGWKIILSDIKILFKTILTVLRARGV